MKRERKLAHNSLFLSVSGQEVHGAVCFGVLFSSRSSVMLLNCSSADCRFSVISRAIMCGGGRFAVSSRLSSLSQNMSRFALSLCKSLS